MTFSGLAFRPYPRTVDIPNVVVDGSPNAATVLTVSHWPGLPTPPGCAADTSAQMAFRYLDRGADLHGDAAVVTNNHFDQDGVAGVYALARPDDARRRRALLEDVASAGDFAVYADRAAARLSMALAALADSARSPLGRLPDDYGEACGLLYAAALERLPGWLDDPEACRALWEEEDAELEAGLRAVAGGSVTVEEPPGVGLAVVALHGDGRSGGHRFAGQRFDGVHPMALHRATDRSVILTLDPAVGRPVLTCRYEGWVQYRSRAIPPRVDLRPLAEELSASESGGAQWEADGPGQLTPELRTAPDGPPSSLDPGRLVAAVVHHLRTAPPAWDPFAA